MTAGDFVHEETAAHADLASWRPRHMLSTSTIHTRCNLMRCEGAPSFTAERIDLAPTRRIKYMKK